MVRADTASSYKAYVLSQGAKYYADFTNSSGTTLSDAGINNISGIVSGAVTLGVVGPPGGYKAANFTGSAGNINLGEPNAIAFNGDLTIGMWIYLKNTNLSGILATDIEGIQSPYQLWIYNNELTLFSGNSSSYVTSSLDTTPPLNQWVYLVVTRSGSVVKWYINGTLSYTGNLTNTPLTTFRANLHFGDINNSGYYFTGLISDTFIDNNAWSDAAVTALYNQAINNASLTAGTLSFTSQTSTSATVSWTAASGGTAPITAQLQRSAHGAGSWSNVSGATATPATDTGLSSNTSYDYQVVYTDAASSTATSNTVTVTTSNTITYNVQQADLWDNGYDNVNAPKQSTFARFVFTTNAASVTVTGDTTMYNSFPSWSTLGVRINGVDQSPLQFTANGSQSFTVTLGSAGTMRMVEIVAGLQSTAGGSTVTGSFVDSVTYPSASTFTVSSPVISNRIVVYGDSIAVGDDAANPEAQAYVPLLRNLYGQSVMLEGWGYRALYDDTHTAGLLAAFVSRLASYNPSTIYLAIGTNDYGLNKWSAGSFGTAYAGLLDGIHVASPSTRIICQTPLVRNPESANSFGNTLTDYRTQIATVCNTRSSYATLVDGTTFLTLSDMGDGSLHPSVAGFAKYASDINNVFTLAPAVSTTAVSTITSTSSATLNGSISNIGSSTPTIRGFAYGLTTAYEIATTTESGLFSTGAFTASISNLTHKTTYHVRAYATNFAGTAFGGDQVFTTLADLPKVTTVAASPTSTSTATLNASITDNGGADATQSGFAYGTSPTLATVIATTTLNGQTGITTFSQSFTGLTPNTTYYFRAYAVNSAGTSTGSILPFATTDTTPPTVTMTAPTGGSTVAGSAVSLSATASDDVGVVGVQFKLDATTNIGSEITVAPYTTTWDSTSITIYGSHTLYAVARDAAGNYATSTVSVNVDNVAPTMSTVVRNSDTQIIVTLSKLANAATITRSNSGGFIVTKTGVPGTTYTVTSIAPGTDNTKVVLTVANLSTSGGTGVTVTYTTVGGIGTVADTLGNLLATNSTGIAIPPWNTVAPIISSITSTVANGSYKSGAAIDIELTFSKPVNSTGSVTVTLNTGGICSFTVTNASTASCTYTVAGGQNTSALNVATVSGTITSTDSNAMTSFAPALNLTDNGKTILIDTIVPIVATTYSSSGGSASSQVNNLLAMGFYTQAQAVAKQYGLTVPTQNIPVQNIPTQNVPVTINTPTLNSGSSFNRSLKLGQTSSDVKKLQIFLNTHGFTVSQKAAGSPGHETNYFGPATKAALMKFQLAYKKEILDPQGLNAPTGFFGVDTMKTVNGLVK